MRTTDAMLLPPELTAVKRRTPPAESSRNPLVYKYIEVSQGATIRTQSDYVNYRRLCGYGQSSRFAYAAQKFRCAPGPGGRAIPGPRIRVAEAEALLLFAGTPVSRGKVSPKLAARRPPRRLNRAAVRTRRRGRAH